MAKRTSAELLLEQIESCSEETLAELDEQIAKGRSELEDFVRERETKITSLQSVRKVIAIRLHGEPPRKKPVRKPQAGQQDGERGTGDGTALADKLYDLIGKSGPLSASQAAQALGSHHKMIYAVVEQSDWFELDGENRIAIAKT